MEGVKKRQIELKRQSIVAAIETSSINLNVGESETFHSIDAKTLIRIKTRLSRLKSEINMEFETKIDMDGSSLTIKRIA